MLGYLRPHPGLDRVLGGDRRAEYRVQDQPRGHGQRVTARSLDSYRAQGDE